MVEHCNWITSELCDMTDPVKIKHGRCAAGYKAMWNKNYCSLPSETFLTTIDPLLKDITIRLYTETYASDIKVGNLNKAWADKLGLSTDVIIGVGAFDAHMGAVGGQIEPYALSKVIGT